MKYRKVRSRSIEYPYVPSKVHPNTSNSQSANIRNSGVQIRMQVTSIDINWHWYCYCMLLSNVLGWPPKPLVIFCLRPGVPNKSDPVASYPESPTSLGLYFDIFLGCYSIIRPHGASYIIFIYNIIWATVKMVENYFSIAGVFCQRFAQNTVKWWPPPQKR